MTNAAWQAWVDRCFRDVDARILAMVRIGIGGVMTLDLLWTWSLGLVPWLYVRAPEGMALPSSSYVLDAWFGPGQGPTAFWVAVASMACVTIGFAMRPAIVVGVVAHAQLGCLLPAAEQGVDHILRTALLILLFAPADARWAVGPSARRDTVPAWSSDLLMWLIVLIYLSSGLCKVLLDWDAWVVWGSLPATYKILADPLSGLLSPMAAWPYRPVFQVLDWATLVFEIGALVLLTRWGRWWAWMGVVMHLGLFWLMKLGQFPFAMLAFYPLWLGAPALAWWDARRSTP